ncbi:MAG TPA: sterol desaturase family protein [Puia sp.]|jgi:sterol desaturase/sphingolipid hydroxylase (fatty acid hydroxylase superfamily)|nr:sterol desaturase family protein [Puia sp.]
MQNIVHFFQHIQSWQRSLILISGIVFFWIIEGIIPLFRFRYNKFKHAGLNLFFTFTTVIINFLFAFLIVFASDYTSQNKLGLLYIFRLPLWLFIIFGLMIMDLIGAWFIHWIEHKIKWMWKFHIVHHADLWVDTTTANRHHPGESVFRALFTLIGVIIAGAPIWLVFVYQALSVLLSQFNHANISLPKSLDNIISWVIVSPDMHKVHHHYVQPLTDSNYGNIFSFWDRIFGTFEYVKDTRKLKYGIDSYMQEQENNRMKKLLTIPFDTYRPPVGAKFSEGK